MEQNKKHEQEMLEQMLKYASVQSLEALYDEYADDTTDDSQPSEQLQNAVAQMLAEARAKEQAAERAQKKAVRRKHMLRRIAAALALVAAIGAVGGVLVMNVEAWRVPFLNFVLEITGEETSVSVGNSEQKNEKIQVSSNMELPAYIPDGYEIERTGSSVKKEYIIYKNALGNVILFSSFNSDEVELSKYASEAKEEIDINGVRGFIVEGENQAKNSLIWGIEENVYTICGDIAIEEIIRMAESIC